MKHRALLLTGLLAISSVAHPYEVSQEIFVGALAGAALNPALAYPVFNPGPPPLLSYEPLYENSHDFDGGLSLRLALGVDLGLGFGADLHVQSSWLQSTALESRDRLGLPETGRSRLFNRRLMDEKESRMTLEIDQAALEYRSGPFSVKAGRQPINWATNFYLVPNDFFAPFLPQQFFRVYKPGVDAVRSTLTIGEFNQLEVLGAFAYKAPSGINNLRHDLDLDRSSLLAKGTLAAFGVDLALIGGRHQATSLAGAALQWEWGGNGIISAEWNAALPGDNQASEGTDLAVGYSHQLSPLASLRVEHAWQGRLDKAAAALPKLAGQPDPSLRRQVTALGGSLQFHPLLNGGAVLQIDWNSGDALAAGNVVYSTGNNSDIALTLSVPVPSQNHRDRSRSAFSLLPSSLLLEWRRFF